MKRVTVTAMMMALAALLCAAHPRRASDDGAAVRKLVTDFAVAWDKSDAKSLSLLWVEDGDLRIPTGNYFHGRDEIEKFYTAVHASGYRGSRATSTINTLRFITSDVAVADGSFEISGAKNPDGKPRLAEKGLFTAIAVKKSGQWYIVALREMSLPASMSAARS